MSETGEPTEFDNQPPDDATLVPVAAFKAFHNNFTGIPRTGEMKLSINIPVDDIHAALDVASARDEILWVQVSKLRFGGENVKQLADKIAEQQREREELGLNAAKSAAKGSTKPAKKKRTTDPISSELDWET